MGLTIEEEDKVIDAYGNIELYEVMRNIIFNIAARREAG